MPHDELKPKDRVVLRMTRDGAVEENLTEGTSEKVSKRLEDAQLVAPQTRKPAILPKRSRSGGSFVLISWKTQRVRLRPKHSPQMRRKSTSRVICPSAMIPHLTLCTLRHTAPIPLTTEKHLPIPLLPVRSVDLVLKGRLMESPFWKERRKPPQRCRTLTAMPQLPGGLNGWSENLRRRMSVWMPPVRSCPPRRC